MQLCFHNLFLPIFITGKIRSVRLVQEFQPISCLLHRNTEGSEWYKINPKWSKEASDYLGINLVSLGTFRGSLNKKLVGILAGHKRSNKTVSRFARRRFSQKNEWTNLFLFCFFTLHSKKTQIRSFIFGRIYGAQICLRFYLTFRGLRNANVC